MSTRRRVEEKGEGRRREKGGEHTFARDSSDSPSREQFDILTPNFFAKVVDSPQLIQITDNLREGRAFFRIATPTFLQKLRKKSDILR
jgi:hypothetical protein